jgi:hypothetical protein
MGAVLTDDDDVTEHTSAADGRTVPAAVSELFLALDGAETHAVPYCHHGVRR